MATSPRPSRRPTACTRASSASAPPAAGSPPLQVGIDTHKTCDLGPTMPFGHHVLASASASSSDDFLILGLVPCAVGAPGSGYGPSASRSTRPSSPGQAPHWRTAAGWSAWCCACRGRATPSRWTARDPAAVRQDGGPGRRSQGRYRIAQSACHPDTT